MPLVMGITIPAGLEIVYNKTLRMYDISVLCNVGKNPRFFPRSQKYTLREITYLFQIAYAWSVFSDADRQAWVDAGDIIGQHGYNLYVQDKSYRIKNGIGGNATPSIYHQFKTGHLGISAPASSALITQFNPHKIYFPASFELNFHSNLTSTGAGSYARCRFIWNRYISGQTIENIETITIPLIQAWTHSSQSIATNSGVKGRWRIEIEAYNVTGDIWWDDIYVTYNGEINLNDPYCDDVATYWQKTNYPEGVILETVYPTGGAL